MSEERIPVSVEIESSSSDGYAVWVRSTMTPSAVWWKWYGKKLDACMEAAQLGLVIREEGPSQERYLRTVSYDRKPDATASPQELARYGYRTPTANA